jgi:hypothetical protein
MEDFNRDGFITVPNFLDSALCGTLYQYSQIQSQRTRIKQQVDSAHYHKAWDGTFEDSQAPGNYALYGDPIMDVVMYQHMDQIRNCVDLDLQPAYTYWRLYVQGSELKNHVDREACEISATICLGQSDANTWPIHLDLGHRGVHSVGLQPGDCLIYRGCDIPHWRDPLRRGDCAQVFWHFTDMQGDRKQVWDGRPQAGVPRNVQVKR